MFVSLISDDNLWRKCRCCAWKPLTSYLSWAFKSNRYFNDFATFYFYLCRVSEPAEIFEGVLHKWFLFIRIENKFAKELIFMASCFFSFMAHSFPNASFSLSHTPTYTLIHSFNTITYTQSPSLSLSVSHSAHKTYFLIHKQ